MKKFFCDSVSFPYWVWILVVSAACFISSFYSRWDSRETISRLEREQIVSVVRIVDLLGDSVSLSKLNYRLVVENDSLRRLLDVWSCEVVDVYGGCFE